MIKNSTISNNQAMKILPTEYKKLATRHAESLELIRQSAIVIREQQEEIKKLKSHWVFRFINWFK